jgi:2'-5' RNA ligase
MRSFVAIPLPNDTRDRLLDLQRHLRVGRAVDYDNLHVTLAFLDDQPEEGLEALHDELETLRLPSFDLTISGVGCYGGDSPRLVYAEIDPTPQLLDLQRAVAKAARRVGIVLARSRFHPHVTLARLKPQDAPGVVPFLQAHAGFRHDVGTLHSFALFQSILKPQGAEYHALAYYPLI